jgi:hypothetical protein
MLVLERYQQFLESIAQPAAQDSRARNHRTGLKVICRLTSSRVSYLGIGGRGPVGGGPGDGGYCDDLMREGILMDWKEEL